MNGHRGINEHRDRRELLLALGWLYLRCGHHRRGLILILLAANAAPEDQAVQRMLAWAFIVNGSGREALAAVERLEAADPDADQPPLRLLRSRALWLMGRHQEARRCFADFVALREAQP